MLQVFLCGAFNYDKYSVQGGYFFLGKWKTSFVKF